MKTCIYARKSTHKLGQKETIENQIKICRSHAQKLDLQIVDIKQDTGTGRDDLNRPEIKELIEDALNGNYECVIMKGISRLYRDTEKGLGLIKLLDRNDIRVITVEEAFDSGDREHRTGTGKLDLSRITMYLMFSEMESKKLADRVKYTQIEKAKSGEWNHANNTPFGYSFNPETKKLVVNSVEAETVKLIFEMYLSGCGLRSIMLFLNGNNEQNYKYVAPNSDKWNQYTVGFILKNQAYVGDVVYNKRSKKERTYKHPELFGKDRDALWVGNDYNDESEWIIARDAHEPIITRDQFEKVQMMLNTKASRKGIKSNVGLLAGIAKCGRCGASMTFKRGNKDKNGRIKTRNNYYCMNYIKYGKLQCTSHHIGADDLENTILDHVIEVCYNPEQIEAIRDKARNKNDASKIDVGKEVTRIQNEIAKLTQKMDKLLEKNLSGDITDQQFKLMNSKFSNEMSQLSDMLTSLNLTIADQKVEDDKANKFMKRIEEFRDIKNRPKEQQRYLLLELIDKIIISDGIIKEIQYNI